MSVRFSLAIARSLFISLALVALVPAFASAQCRLEITRTPSEVRFNYDPFLPSMNPERITLDVHNPSTEPCEAEFAILDQGGSPTSRLPIAQTGLIMEVITVRSGLQPGRESGVMRLRIEGGETLEAPFEMKVVGERVVEAGLYDQPLTLRLRDVPGLAPGRDIPLNISLRSLPRAQLNLAGALGSFGEGLSISRVDFGKAETGKTERVYVQSRTNAPARILIRSLNRGLLRAVIDPDTAPGLAYSASLGGDPINLAQADVFDVDTPRTYQGSSLELVLTLGQVEGARAGAYSDELTIEISTL